LAVTGTTTPDDIGYGSTATVTATANSPTGSTLTYAWKNGTATGLGSVVQDATNKNVATVTMPTFAAATAARKEGGVASQYVSATPLESRMGVARITYDARGAVSTSVTVSDNRGKSTTASVSLNSASSQTGNRNVPIGQRVYVNSGAGTGNAWTLDKTGATGSAAALDSTTNQLVSFVADKAGKYVLATGGNSITVYAGDWVGAVVGGSGGPGAESVSVDSTCTTCHAPSSLALDMFTPWAGTNHAIKFAKGLVGDNGTSWSVTGCGTCHTVGYDLGVTNNGFDDLQKTAGWTMPAMSSTAWSTLASTTDAPTKAMLKMTNIQCENCHGPNGAGGGHMAGTGSTSVGTQNQYLREYGNPRVSFSGETCATCHAAGTGHHLYSEWKTTDPVSGMGHSANSATVGAIAHALSGSGAAQTLNGHCGRCHSAQGFVQYADQVTAGNPGNLTYVAGVNASNVEPVTCTACHDPHSDKNPNQLRIFGDTPTLASGFSMAGVGKGALCMTCHNSRNGTAVVVDTTRTCTTDANCQNVAGKPDGYCAAPKTGGATKYCVTGNDAWLHEDNQTYDAGKGAGNPTGFSAPHQACQTDVFAGRNAYFMGNSLPMTSRHAAVEDTCVGCHMANNPATHLSHGTPAINGHEFRITDANKGTLCAACHSASVNGEGIQGQVESLLGTLDAKMGQALVAKIASLGNKVQVVAYDASTDLYSIAPGKSPTLLPLVIDLTAGNAIVSATPVEVHGQISFQITLKTAISIQYVDSTNAPKNAPVSTTTFAVQLGSFYDMTSTTTPATLYTVSGNMVRAGWNRFLIEGDQSKGIHNPTFAFNVLNTTIGRDLSN
jgi:hypothetical protein